MASTRTFLELQTSVYNDGDLRLVRHPLATVKVWINQGVKELYNLLVNANQDLYMDSDDITVTAGTIEYSLDAEFFKSLGVDKLLSTGKYAAIRRFNNADRNQRVELRYRIMGSKLRLSGPDDWSGTLRHWFIPAATALSDDTDTFDGINGFEDYVINYCLIKAKTKDDEDLGELPGIKKDLEQKIKDTMQDRDEGEPDQVRDVSGAYAENKGW